MGRAVTAGQVGEGKAVTAGQAGAGGAGCPLTSLVSSLLDSLVTPLFTSGLLFYFILFWFFGSF